jgi:hypothetical protein
MSVQTASTKSRRATWGPWSPAQIVAVVLGGFLVILGTMALARVGMSSLTSPTDTVWGLAHTPLMALIEIALGLFILTSAPYPFTARTTLCGIGALMAVFGIVMLIEPAVFSDTLGINRQMGLLYTATGAGSTVLGWVSPVLGR